MNDNDFEYLPDGLFDSMKQLKKLSLSCENLTPRVFKELVNLEDLELVIQSKDKIEIWRLSLFQNQKKLKKLKFEWRENEHYDPFYFDQDEFYDHSDEVSILKFLSKNSNECAFLKGLSNLEEMSLSGLNKNFFKTKCFSGMDSLRKLNLEKNSLETLELLDGLKSLNELNMSHNQIKSIDSKDSFRDLVCLQALDLSENKIELLNLEAFNMLTTLEKLNLSGNPISKKMDSDLLSRFKTLKEFKLAEEKQALQDVSEKLKKINEDSTAMTLKLTITNHFKCVKSDIESTTKKLQKSSSPNEAQLLEKTKAEFEKKIQEIEEFNLNHLESNYEFIAAKINEIKKLNLKEETFDLKQKKELLKQNCLYIQPSNFKKKNVRSKYPLGVLIVTDWLIAHEKFYNFR